MRDGEVGDCNEKEVGKQEEEGGVGSNERRPVNVSPYPQISGG